MGGAGTALLLAETNEPGALRCRVRRSGGTVPASATERRPRSSRAAPPCFWAHAAPAPLTRRLIFSDPSGDAQAIGINEGGDAIMGRRDGVPCSVPHSNGTCHSVPAPLPKEIPVPRSGRYDWMRLPHDPNRTPSLVLLSAVQAITVTGHIACSCRVVSGDRFLFLSLQFSLSCD